MLSSRDEDNVLSFVVLSPLLVCGDCLHLVLNGTGLESIPVSNVDLLEHDSIELLLDLTDVQPAGIILLFTCEGNGKDGPLIAGGEVILEAIDVNTLELINMFCGVLISATGISTENTLPHPSPSECT